MANQIILSLTKVIKRIKQNYDIKKLYDDNKIMTYRISKYIAIATYVEKPKHLIIWNGRSSGICLNLATMHS
jgi:hypothetical protein